jgi:hypothetical protein
MEEDDPTNVETEILTEDDEQELTELVLEALNGSRGFPSQCSINIDGA